ncbi:MAG: radical SAM protein [Brevinematia bacterium]
MKSTNYFVDFLTENEYVLYSWFGNSYTSFPLEWKEDVIKILSNPEDVVSNKDAKIYKKLVDGKLLIPDNIDEYNLLLELRNQDIYRIDKLILTIVPTLNCNCRCPYCYEIHPEERMSYDVVKNICKLIENRAKTLNFLGISWFGGEPLLMPEIIEEIGTFAVDISKKWEIKFNTGITTNAVLLNDKIINIFDKIQLRDVHFTLDGGKTRHNKMRTLVGGQPTFDTIIKNVTNFLEANPLNKIAVRIHIHSGEETELNEILSIFDIFKKFKDRVDIYFRDIYSSCTEDWDGNKDNESNCTYKINSSVEKFLLNELSKRGFSSPLGLKREYKYCDAEIRNSFLIHPDGFVTKCTVAIEKERAIGRLTEKGIGFFYSRLIPFEKKKLLETGDCKDCKFLPYCWGQCAYQNYQKERDKLLERCKGLKNENIIMNEIINNIKEYYIQKIRK